jgi:hypothetical protein
MPIRSERDAFYVSLGLVAIATVSVLLGVATEPVWGVVLFVVAVGGAVLVDIFMKDPDAALSFRKASAEPHPGAIPQSWRILVIANESLKGAQIKKAIMSRAKLTTEIMVVAPVLTSKTHWVTTDVDAEMRDARKRLDETLAWARERGYHAQGHIGDPIQPMMAIEDELRQFGAHEVIIATHPVETANWAEQEMLDKLQSELDLPVIQVVPPGGSDAEGEAESVLTGLVEHPLHPKPRARATKGVQPTRVLVVANKTAATPDLLAAVGERAKQSKCTFTLLVPSSAHGLHKIVDPEDQSRSEAEQVVAKAVPLLQEAAGSKVDYLIGDPVPIHAVHDAVNVYGFDEIILSTYPAHFSHWIRMDLPSKLSGLKIPVTTVSAKG